MTTNTLNRQFVKGLTDEKLVKLFTRSQGCLVEPSTYDQDRHEDIDCFVDGKAVSIKAQHSGAKYGNIYFELAQHLTEHKDCQLSAAILSSHPHDASTPDLLIATGSWEPSWWYTGKAKAYYILQGSKLYIYSKRSILKYVHNNGWLRVRSLSYGRRSYLGGSYRYCNSICGFLNIDDVAHQTFDVANIAQLSLR